MRRPGDCKEGPQVLHCAEPASPGRLLARHATRDDPASWRDAGPPAPATGQAQPYRNSVLWTAPDSASSRRSTSPRDTRRGGGASARLTRTPRVSSIAPASPRSTRRQASRNRRPDPGKPGLRCRVRAERHPDRHRDRPALFGRHSRGRHRRLPHRRDHRRPARRPLRQREAGEFCRRSRHSDPRPNRSRLVSRVIGDERRLFCRHQRAGPGHGHDEQRLGRKRALAKHSANSPPKPREAPKPARALPLARAACQSARGSLQPQSIRRVRPPRDRAAQSAHDGPRHARRPGPARAHQRRGPHRADAVARELPYIAPRRRAASRRSQPAGGCSTWAPAPAGGSACSTPPSARPRSAPDPDRSRA